MSKFTKGKWKYAEPLGVVFSEDTCAVIATVHGAGTGSCFNLSPEGQANARLIAAAPEMYELIDRLVRRSPNTTEEVSDTLTGMKILLARIDGKETAE